MDAQLLREILAESEDLIEVLFGDIQALRARHSEGRARREIVARMFRHVHTIKGSSAAVELDSAAQIAHEVETLLDGVRLGRIAINDDVLNAFDDGAAAIAQTLRAASRHETAPPVNLIVERIKLLARESIDEAVPASDDGRVATGARPALPEDIARSLSVYESQRLREALAEGARLFIIAINFDLATFDEQFRNLSAALAQNGELISTMPGLDAAAPDQINFRIIYATEAAHEEVAGRAGSFGAVEIFELASARASATDDEGAGESVEAATDDSLTGVAGSRRSSSAPLSTVVRVELSELDNMISAAHELFSDTNGALDLALAGDLARTQRTDMELRAARIRRRFVEFEERLIELRMIPVEQTLERAARAGAMAARAVGKEVDFEITGGDVHLDKSLADAVSDPLLHILRNAVDHAIETVDERAASGKSARGQIRLEAVAEGSRVRLRVTDDGRGIDPQRVTRVAIERSIIKEGASLTKQQSLRLIFRPGFSTAAAVSSVSGRGVGLDVVESAVEQVGGELRVSSETRVGTTIEMILPTTLALVPSLVVRSNGLGYCVSASHITEAGYIAAHEVKRISNDESISWRGVVTPLIPLRRLLAQPAARGNDLSGKLHIIISHIAGQEATESDESEHSRVAIVVDGWDGHQEVLVRGLGRHAARWRGISGAAELGDGTIALVLDLPRLLEMAI